MIVKDIQAKSILTRSGIPGAEWCVNPYVGCAHACRYCYAVFMKRFTGHPEPWGSFVDARVNAPDLLLRQIRRSRPGRVFVGSVTDAWQPLEESRLLTRRCLEVLLLGRFPVRLLTKSPLILRDIDLLRRFSDLEVGITITTNDERMRRAFEPGAPSIESRLEALGALTAAGLSTFAFVAPILPQDPEVLAARIGTRTGSIVIDEMNYSFRTRALYRSLGFTGWLDREFQAGIKKRLETAFKESTLESPARSENETAPL